MAEKPRRRSSIFGREIIDTSGGDSNNARYPSETYEQLKMQKHAYADNVENCMSAKFEQLDSEPKKSMDFCRLSDEKQDFLNSLTNLNEYISAVKDFNIGCDILREQMKCQEKELLNNC